MRSNIIVYEFEYYFSQLHKYFSFHYHNLNISKSEYIDQIIKNLYAKENKYRKLKIHITPFETTEELCNNLGIPIRWLDNKEISMGLTKKDLIEALAPIKSDLGIVKHQVKKNSKAINEIFNLIQNNTSWLKK